MAIRPFHLPEERILLPSYDQRAYEIGQNPEDHYEREMSGIRLIPNDDARLSDYRREKETAVSAIKALVHQSVESRAANAYARVCMGASLWFAVKTDAVIIRDPATFPKNGKQVLSEVATKVLRAPYAGMKNLFGFGDTDAPTWIEYRDFLRDVSKDKKRKHDDRNRAAWARVLLADDGIDPNTATGDQWVAAMSEIDGDDVAA